MTKTFQFVAAAFATILVCSVAGAQMRGGAAPMRVSSVRVASAMRAVPASPRTIRPLRVIQISPSGQVTSSFSPAAFSTSFGSTSGVPGLGFDYPHLAAISGGLQNGRSSNSGRGGHRSRADIVPILVGGYPYYDYGGFYEDSSGYDQAQSPQQFQQQPQVIVIQQPVPMAQQAADSGTYAAPVVAPPAPVKVPDVGEFVLVRRDGRVLFASAFFVSGTQLTYISLEGIRRTLPLADLDADATQQMNEARGTTVQIHN
jgi:hypothetical protein